MRGPVVGLLLLLALAQSSLADCGDDPANLYRFENCDFDASTAGWTGSSISRGATSFPAGSPAGNLTNFGSGVITATGPCIATAAEGLSYNFGAHFRVTGGTGGTVHSCRIVLTTYSQANCTGTSTIFEPADTNVPVWTHSADTALIPAGTLSVNLGTSCESTPATNFSVAMDNFYIGEGITVPVELKAFEVD